MLLLLIVSTAGLKSASGRPATVDQLWLATYDGPENGADTAYGMAMSPDGSTVVVTGASEGLDLDYATVAYDATTGSSLWAQRYDSARLDDLAYAIAIKPDGSTVFVTGTSGRSRSGDDYATVAYDTRSGTRLWVARYTGPGRGDDAAQAVKASPDGSRVFVTGSSIDHASDYATVAYDAGTGQQLWAARYGGEFDDYAYALDVSPDGSRVFVTGRNGHFDLVTLAYDAQTGQGLWHVHYSLPHDGTSAYAIGSSPDGSTVFVTGYSGPNYVTIAYDAATGEERWISYLDGPNGRAGGAQALGVSPDGSRVFVTGNSYQLEGNSDANYVTVAYDAITGDELWHARFSGPGHHDDAPYDLAVSPDGSTVFAAGSITTPGGPFDVDYDYAAVGYDAATGTQLALAQFDSGNDDDGYAVAVSPDGSLLFMTGRVNSGADYGTVAFSLTP
jgi:outer membrane protein assembly factor BamB